ncbi:MAG: OmpA family protein [Planctomycetales bacterium]|nr:OmpA family protein [Planctomycetales bacterium]
MQFQRHAVRAFLHLSLATCAGCGAFVPGGSQALRLENNRLGEERRAQAAEIANLRSETQQLEQRLREAQEKLASLAKIGTSQQKLALLREERARLRGQLLEAPANAPANGNLVRLAERYPQLRYDPQSGIAKLETDILFDSGLAEIKPAAQQLLEELSAMLSQDETADLKVMVVGHTDDERIAGPRARDKFPSNWHLSTARAQAVAQRLIDLGVDGQRLGVAGFSQYQPVAANDQYRAQAENRRVEVFVVSPHVPVVGMTETLINLY